VIEGLLTLDGGLATELEARGADLNDELWSAKLLLEDPESIRAVHRDYLEAGADCIVTATYQASYEGFRARGLADGEATDLFHLAVRLAVDVREEFWAEPANREGRIRPLVAASLGPYGAYLADGSEYRGDYGVQPDGLRAFHASRWRAVRGQGADLTAWETVPSYAEALVLADLLLGAPEERAWISFSCRDERHISDGTALAEVVARLEAVPNLVAVGVNCTHAHLVAPLLTEARAATTKPIFVYPNSGGDYDAEKKDWETRAVPIDWPTAVRQWCALGASGVGGCCRVGPEDIRVIHETLRAIADGV